MELLEKRNPSSFPTTVAISAHGLVPLMGGKLEPSIDLSFLCASPEPALGLLRKQNPILFSVLALWKFPLILTLSEE